LDYKNNKKSKQNALNSNSFQAQLPFVINMTMGRKIRELVRKFMHLSKATLEKDLARVVGRKKH